MATMTVNVAGNPIVACDANITAGGGAGVYELILNIGTNLGWTGIRYDAISVPDRFEIYYNNSKVADTKFVGDLIELPTNPTGNIVLGSYVMNNYTYNGSAFVSTGSTSNVTIGSTDMSNNTTEPTNGNGVLIFNKTTASPNTIRIIATGSPNQSTSWNIRGICPTLDENLIQGTEKFVYTFFNEANKGLQTRSAKFVLGNSPVKFYTDRLGGTAFNTFGYTVTAQYINDGTTWWRLDATGNILDTGLL